MKTIGYVLLLLAVIVVARVVGGAAGRISAEERTDTASREMIHFLEEMERFQGDSITRGTAARNSYMGDLTASGWDSLFDPDRMKSDAGLSDSKMIISKAKAAFENYKLQVLADMDASKEQIRSLDISDEEEQIMLSSFASGSSNNNEIFVLEEQALTRAEQIVSLLASNTSWTVENSRVVFSDDSLRTEVSSHFQKINEISHRQQEIQAAALNNSGTNRG